MGRFILSLPKDSDFEISRSRTLGGCGTANDEARLLVG